MLPLATQQIAVDYDKIRYIHIVIEYIFDALTLNDYVTLNIWRVLDLMVESMSESRRNVVLHLRLCTVLSSGI
jgi:hypothetical protein